MIKPLSPALTGQVAGRQWECPPCCSTKLELESFDTSVYRIARTDLPLAGNAAKMVEIYDQLISDGGRKWTVTNPHQFSGHLIRRHTASGGSAEWERGETNGGLHWL